MRVEGVRRLGGLDVAGEEVVGIQVQAVVQAGEEGGGGEGGEGGPREMALDRERVQWILTCLGVKCGGVLTHRCSTSSGLFQWS